MPIHCISQFTSIGNENTNRRIQIGEYYSRLLCGTLFIFSEVGKIQLLVSLLYIGHQIVTIILSVS